MQDDAKKQIEALEIEYAKLLNANQYDRVANTFYSEDATFLTPNAPAAKGRSAIRAVMEEIGKAYSNIRVEAKTIEVSGDLAVAIGEYHADVALPDGRKVKENGSFIEGWRRGADGSWNCFADTFTSDGEHA